MLGISCKRLSNADFFLTLVQTLPYGSTVLRPACSLALLYQLMASSTRNRGTLYLLMGFILLGIQLYRLPGFYTDWQLKNLDTPRFFLSMIILVGALFMLRAGWRMRRGGHTID